MLPNKGRDGREIELRKGAYYIQWRYKGEPRWYNLIAIDELKGEKGKSGNSLNLGLAARQVQLRSENGYIQWRWAGQRDWTNLYKIPSGGSGGGGPVDYNDVVNKPDLTLKADKHYVDSQDTVLTKKIDTGLQDKVNKAGDTMTGNLIVPSVSINGSDFLTGTGFPNGVVAAPVGSIYVDKNLTCGAALWVKKTGSGNTGWEVLTGDTGWRNITSLLINGWVGFFAKSIYIRRVNSDVRLNIDGVKADNTTGQVPVKVPLGFRSSGKGGSVRFLLHSINTNPTQIHRGYVSGGDVNINGIVKQRLDIFGGLRFTTDDPWPTELPGEAS